MTLREMREAAGLTQEQAAERSEISQGSISALEIGKVTSPRLDTLEKLAACYGVGMDAVVAALRETVAAEVA